MTLRRTILALACGGVLMLCATRRGAAQTASDTLITARAAVKAGRYNEAVALLQPFLPRQRTPPPAARSDPPGAAAYWLGRAYAATGRPERALDTWTAGIEVLQARGLFNLRLADAFVRAAFRQRAGGYYLRAADAYRQLLRRAGGALDANEGRILRKHLEAVALLLPDSLRQALGLTPLMAPRENEDADFPPLHLPERAGCTLLQWWRGQDPKPATSANERLHQHLERAVYARTHFTWHGRLDDRGDVYVRLGPPYKEKTIRFNNSRFREKVLEPSVALTASNFDDAVFWIYPQIDYAAHFLFVEHEHGRYLLGTPAELIPSTMTTGLGPSRRGRRKGEAYARAIALLYRQLSLYHTSYGFIYNEAANYVATLEMAAFSGQPLPPSELSPSAFAQTMRSRISTHAWRTARRRRKAVPRSYSDPLRHAAPLVAENVRVARFLEPDGGTRTEIYWSLPAYALIPSEERMQSVGLEPEDVAGRYLLSATLTQWGAGYQERQLQRERFLITQASEAGVLAPQTLVARGDTGRYHLALQWDAYLAYEATQPDAPPRLGPHLKTDTYRIDSLYALPTNSYRLVMSDLKPLVVGERTKGPAAALADARAYPFDRITAATPLALYFEIYHLAYGEGDRTHYTVAYEIFRRTEQGFLERIFTSEDTQRTTTQATYSGRSRTAEEYILLDFSERAEPGKLVITVRVTDEVTGRQTQRSIRFDVVEAEE